MQFDRNLLLSTRTFCVFHRTEMFLSEILFWRPRDATTTAFKLAVYIFEIPLEKVKLDTYFS